MDISNWQNGLAGDFVSAAKNGQIPSWMVWRSAGSKGWQRPSAKVNEI
jgi:hypothetical protein